MISSKIDDGSDPSNNPLKNLAVVVGSAILL